MIALDGLRVSAGGFRVGPVDLAVADGEYAVLLGPSGAGKSLILEAVAGVRRVAGGTVAVAGVDVTALAPERRRVGLVFQEGLLFPNLTVAANIGYGLRAVAHRRADTASASLRSRAARRAEVERLARLVGAEALLARHPATLSGGERQRVALARALAARPRALLLDEPLSAVDAEARDGLHDVLRRVCREERLPLLHVTHHRAEAFALADVCAVVIAGEVHQIGQPLAVLRQPEDAAVAAFLGARNLLAAVRDGDDPRLAHLRAGGVVRCGAPLPASDSTLVIRPEDVRISPARQDRGLANRLDGTVTALTLQDGQVLVRLETPGPLEALVPASDVRRADIAPGAVVSAWVDPADVHTLPAG